MGTKTVGKSKLIMLCLIIGLVVFLWAILSINMSNPSGIANYATIGVKSYMLH